MTSRSCIGGQICSNWASSVGDAPGAVANGSVLLSTAGGMAGSAGAAAMAVNASSVTISNPG